MGVQTKRKITINIAQIIQIRPHTWFPFSLKQNTTLISKVGAEPYVMGDKRKLEIQRGEKTYVQARRLFIKANGTQRMQLPQLGE